MKAGLIIPVGLLVAFLLVSVYLTSTLRYSFTLSPPQPTVDFFTHISGQDMIPKQTLPAFSIGHLSKAFDPFCSICDKHVEGKYHLISSFYPVTHPKWRASVKAGQGPEVDKQLKERVDELLIVLQANLNNDLVIAVHIIVDHLYSMHYLMQAPLSNKDKLIYHLENHELSYASVVKYMQDYLFGKPVIWSNQDIVLGPGLEKVNIETLRKKDLAYALSRRGRKEKYCTMPDPCGPGQPSIGSHDTYILVQKKNYSAAEIKELDFKLDVMGAENVFIYFLRNVGHYLVLNPCKVLFTYHVHCRQFHSVLRPRVNINGKTGSADFTDKLE